MRIAVNARFLLKDKLEGIGWFSFEILKELVRQQPDDEFIFFFDRPYDAAFVFADNITPVVLQPPARHPILFVLWFEWSVARALKRYKADVFFSPDNFCSLRTDCPTLLVVHDLSYLHFPKQVSWMQLQYYRYFMPRFIQKAERIATVSNYTKQDMLAQFPIPASKIAVSCNGCRPEFQPLSLAEKKSVQAKYAAGEAYFFYVGAVHPRKNIHRLIAAFDRFKQATNSSMQLLIAGRFSWQTGIVRDAYEAAVHQADIQFLGYVSNEELPRLVAAASALTYISLFEGFGVPLLEAMHCDVPIITSNISSLPEVAGKAAVLVNAKKEASIAEAMQQIVTNPVLRQQLIEEGRLQRQKFSWQKAAAVISQELGKLETYTTKDSK